MIFNKWSQFNTSAKKILLPNLGIRSWGEIDSVQKENIWRHFINKGWFAADEDTHKATYSFAQDYKARSFCNHLLQHGGPHQLNLSGFLTSKCCLEAAQKDFNYIFHEETQDVVYELISYYMTVLKKNSMNIKLSSLFVIIFNDISDQFGLNILLNDGGFILRQDKKITEEIYMPVMNYLNDKKWEPVNRDLGDAMSVYLTNTEESYSSSITLTISALQAFMQIVVNGAIGKGDLGKLITEAQSKKLIPNDPFTTKIFKDIESILMEERQAKGNPHPKKEYANEKSARLILNLTMIFMQHCLQ